MNILVCTLNFRPRLFVLLTQLPISLLAALQNITLYNAYQLFHQHICYVCGSFQCPYCPYYNSAPPLLAPLSLLVALASVLLGFYVKRCLIRTEGADRGEYFDR